MNPIMMGMLVKAKQAEIIQEARKQRVFAIGQEAGDHSESLKKLPFDLGFTGAVILLILWAIGAV